MKTKINNYTFNKTAKTVTFTGYTTIRLDGLLLIVNSTDNIIIFNFADPLKGGTVTGNILTLTYDTSSMDNTDKLLIYYDDISANQLVNDLALLNELKLKADQTEEQLVNFNQAIELLIQSISYPPTIDRTINRLRVDTIGTSTVTFAPNQDIRNLTSLVGLDGYYARQEVMAQINVAYANCVRNKIT